MCRYVDQDADLAKAARIIVDSKTDYPSACNAAETILFHIKLLESGAIDRLLRELRAAGVTIFGGPKAVKLGLTEQSVLDFHHEYGSLSVSVEVVQSVDEAIEHIHAYGR